MIFDVGRSIMGPGSVGWAVLGDVGPTTVELAVAFAFLGMLDDIGGLGESRDSAVTSRHSSRAV